MAFPKVKYTVPKTDLKTTSTNITKANSDILAELIKMKRTHTIDSSKTIVTYPLTHSPLHATSTVLLRHR